MSSEIPVSKVLIQNSEGKFLAVQKSEDYQGFTGGKWELPGGRIEEEEGRFDAARREVKAETGLEPVDLRDLVRVKVEKNHCVNCWIIFTEEFSGEVSLSEEHQDWKWVSAEEFREMEWHRDAGYGIPAMEYPEEYLDEPD